MIRARPDDKDNEKLKAELSEYGATFIVTDQELEKDEVMNQIWSKGCPKPKLAFDCVGGKNANNCLSYLDVKGVMVTYGILSGEPLTIPTRTLIFKDWKIRSFTLLPWFKSHCEEEFEDMMKVLISLIKQGKLRLPKIIPVELSDFKHAFEIICAPFSTGKVVFTMNN